MVIRSTSALATSAERGARTGTNARDTEAAVDTAASTADFSHRVGEYHITTEAVRGYA